MVRIKTVANGAVAVTLAFVIWGTSLTGTARAAATRDLNISMTATGAPASWIYGSVPTSFDFAPLLSYDVSGTSSDAACVTQIGGTAPVDVDEVGLDWAAAQADMCWWVTTYVFFTPADGSAQWAFNAPANLVIDGTQMKINGIPDEVGIVTVKNFPGTFSGFIAKVDGQYVFNGSLLATYNDDMGMSINANNPNLDMMNAVGVTVGTFDIEIPIVAPVFFEANGGTGTMSPAYTDGTGAVTLPSNSFARSGYVFAGWSIAEDGPVDYEDGVSLVGLLNDMTLYAQWTEATVVDPPDTGDISMLFVAITSVFAVAGIILAGVGLKKFSPRK